MIRTLRRGMKGDDVTSWQNFLTGQGYALGRVDGDFGGKTHDATKAFQKDQKLKDVDGIVGQGTLLAAMKLGFPVVEEPAGDSRRGSEWPGKPNFDPLTGNDQRAGVFGRFQFRSAGTRDNPEAIEILGSWEADNIVRVDIPQLAGVKGAPRTGVVRFHKLAAAQLQRLWAAWEKAKLLDRVLTWEGSFVPRFVRGSRSNLSNHSFGSAFDINYEWNMLGARPALLGDKGCVRELVAAAHAHGFYWGGHFSRLDGMHFEVATVKP